MNKNRPFSMGWRTRSRMALVDRDQSQKVSGVQAESLHDRRIRMDVRLAPTRSSSTASRTTSLSIAPILSTRSSAART